MLTPKIIIACVCFIISSTSAQSTVYDDAGYYPEWIFEDVLRELKELKAMVDQLTVATSTVRENVCNNSKKRCPSDFTYVPSVNGCYHVVVDNLEWTMAGLRCQSLNPDAHLVIINNAAEQQAIRTLLSSYNSSRLSSCARYPDGHSCREMFWTAGQRVDLTRESPFAWKRTPGTGSCCEGPSMTEMTYTNWAGGEPNNRGSYDAHLRRTSPHVTEKCMQICHGWSDRWNDALCEIPTCSICEIDL